MTVFPVIEKCGTSAELSLKLPVGSDTCTTAHRAQVAPPTPEAHFSSPSGTHRCVKTGVTL